MKIYRISKYIIAQSDAYAAWILPSGEVIKIDTAAEEGHEAYIRRNPEKFNATRKQILDLGYQSWKIYDLAFNSGAVRIAKHYGYLGIEGNRSSIRKFADTIHKMAKYGNVSEIFCRTREEPNGKQINIEDIYDI